MTTENEYDETYTACNLIAVLYQALMSGHQYDRYIEEADADQRSDVADFFREAQKQDADRVEQCTAFLTGEFTFKDAPPPRRVKFPPKPKGHGSHK